MKYNLFLFFLLFCSFSLQAQEKIKFSASYHTEVKEPSDIAFDPITKKYFIVSDNGFLHETDVNGKILRTATFEGYDVEAVWVKDSLVYIVEEMVRKIRVFKTSDLSLVKTIHVPYSGGRNKAYEAITYNPVRNSFILITEKDPIYLFELNENLTVTNEIELKKIARDISSATFHQNYLLLLSDEDREVIQLNPTTYEVLKRWKLPIINPEGFTFNDKGELLVVSDDMEMIYVFDALIFTK